jgi:ferredoxin-NADP reductase
MNITLLDRKEICRATWEFALSKPDGLNFKPGQHINIKLPHLLHEDPKGPRRTFSLTSAPHESNWLIATRMTGSGFKKTLLDLPLGTELEFLGPMGTMTADEKARGLVFLAGGIGITPFRSITLDLLHRSSSVKTVLFYANRDQMSSAYHSLFSGLATDRFHYVPTLSEEADPSWSGERRMLGLDLLQSYLPDLQQPTYYLCGPPALVTDLIQLLQTGGVHKESIVSESFWGYL